MKLEQFFANHPVFTSDEFFAYLGKSGNCQHDTAKSLLMYHKKSGRLLQIRRGLFAVVPVTEKTKKFQVNPFLIAGRITDDSILAYHTALELHGFAYSTFNHFYYLTRKRVTPFTFQENTFQAIKFPKTLLDTGKTNFATTTINREGLDLKVTTIERALVDSLQHPEYTGDWEEIWSSFSMVSALRLDPLIEYTLLLDNATTIAKVGFFLEQRREQFSVTEEYLQKLESHIPKNKHYLERSKRISGKFIKRWNLIVPEKILAEQWEEPNEIF